MDENIALDKSFQSKFSRKVKKVRERVRVSIIAFINVVFISNLKILTLGIRRYYTKYYKSNTKTRTWSNICWTYSTWLL